jgi:imidazole glycerol-phosphate synthase subunit HisH
VSRAKADIAIIDYGMGNTHSVLTALTQVAPKNARISLTYDAQTILQASHVVFPGVGAIADCMAAIVQYDLDQILAQVVKNKPLLGVCVGMQALMSFSDENNGVKCLNFFPGKVKRFTPGAAQSLKVPHMGWNQVQYPDSSASHPLWRNIPDKSWFYFVHSYYLDCLEQEYTAGWCNYGHKFVAAAARENIFAVQFHPEKSHTHGLEIYKNFLNWHG